MEDILKEINYELEKVNKILDITENTDKDQHLIALGQVMALQNIKYSIEHNNYRYKKGGKPNNE